MLQTHAKANQAACWPLPVARLADPENPERRVEASVWWPKGKPYPKERAYSQLARAFRERFGTAVPKEPRRLRYTALVGLGEWTGGLDEESKAEMEAAGLEANYQRFEIRGLWEDQPPDYIGDVPSDRAMTLWRDGAPFVAGDAGPKRKPKSEPVCCQYCGSKLKIAA